MFHIPSVSQNSQSSQFPHCGFISKVSPDFRRQKDLDLMQDVAEAAQRAMLAWFEDALKGTQTLSKILLEHGHISTIHTDTETESVHPCCADK